MRPNQCSRIERDGSKASADVFGIIAKRVSEGFDEARLYTKKQAVAE